MLPVNNVWEGAGQGLCRLEEIAQNKGVCALTDMKFDEGHHLRIQLRKLHRLLIHSYCRSYSLKSCDIPFYPATPNSFSSRFASLCNHYGNDGYQLAKRLCLYATQTDLALPHIYIHGRHCSECSDSGGEPYLLRALAPQTAL